MVSSVRNGDEGLGVRCLKILGLLCLWDAGVNDVLSLFGVGGVVNSLCGGKAIRFFSEGRWRVGGLRGALGPDWLRNHNEFDENTVGKIASLGCCVFRWSR